MILLRKRGSTFRKKYGVRNSVEERQLKLLIGNTKRNSHTRKSRFRLPLESYSTDEGATAGAWVLLEAGEQGSVRRSGRALAPNVRNAELLA